MKKADTWHQHACNFCIQNDLFIWQVGG